MARGHRLNTSIVLAAVHGLCCLFRAVSAVEPSLFRPLRPLSPSLISHLASVDVKQNVLSFHDFSWWREVFSVHCVYRLTKLKAPVGVVGVCVAAWPRIQPSGPDRRAASEKESNRFITDRKATNTTAGCDNRGELLSV